MIETIAKAELPVDELLEIKKNRIVPLNGISNGKRICVVTGIHGDELEGQYVCYEVNRRIRENIEYLKGTVDIYPALNPFGIDSITRGIPAFDLDMNRLFPGNSDGDMNEHIAAQIIEDMVGADICVDIHASNIFLTEVPQIRINELHKDWLVPIAMNANVDLIWVHGASTVLESTFAYSLNSRKTATLVVEVGVGMRITKEYGNQITEGIFSLMKNLGIWEGPVDDIKKPVVAADENGGCVCYMNAPVSGIYIKAVNHGEMVEQGAHIGDVVNPLTGELLAKIDAPEAGWLFTQREYPILEEGSLMGRILKKDILENQ
ncbi:MAG: M14 family metallopeptidase [Clostridium sp.]|nr:M14 family metallopeptidase [Clostridium sp.]